MERKYLNVGKQFNDTDLKRHKITVAIKSLQWFNLHPKVQLPFMQGMGIKAMIQQMGCATDKVAHGIFEHGMALLAIRNNYRQGNIRRATLYAIDTGVELINVAADEETESDVLIAPDQQLSPKMAVKF